MSNDALDAGVSTPVEPSVSEEVNRTEPNTAAETASTDVVETKQDESAKTFTQAEVDAMVQKAKLKAARSEARRLESQLYEQQKAKNLEEPKRDEFRDDDAYAQAQIEHLVEKRAAEKLAERERKQQQERVAETFIAKAEKAAERYEDFDAVVGNPRLHINSEMAEFIADSDVGPDVAYYLGKNPLKAAQIAQMSPIKAARELTRIEGELASKPKPRPSNAPAPIAPISGSSGGSKSPAEMTDAEYAKWRKSASK